MLGYHHPLEIAKRYGTLDRLSGGRLVLGVGVGSLEEEFDLLGVPFADRGERADDALRALRARRVAAAARSTTARTSASRAWWWTRARCRPTCRSGSVGAPPGRSGARWSSADGWCPFGLTPAAAADLVARARASAAWAERDQALEVVLQNLRPVDPLGEPDTAADAARDLRAAGATMLSLRFVHHSVDHYIEQLAAMVAVVERL